MEYKPCQVGVGLCQFEGSGLARVVATASLALEYIFFGLEEVVRVLRASFAFFGRCSSRVQHVVTDGICGCFCIEIGGGTH